jgi:tRNA(Ile)-lysidine synthase
MKIDMLPAGRYVIAVSGGVDSMALLHILGQRQELELVVAHFNHGIRGDAAEDERLVRDYATSHNLTYVSNAANLGSSASEASARKARYNFLFEVCKKYNAKAIITAHHQDDLLETAIINLMRGTGRRGLSDLRIRAGIVRPALNVAKSELIVYAKAHGLQWHEDSTNTDLRYMRNYIRHTYMPRLTASGREKLLQLISQQAVVNKTIDSELERLTKRWGRYEDGALVLPRHELIMVPPAVGYELLQELCKRLVGSTLERPLAEKALLFIKTARQHKQMNLAHGWWLMIGKGKIIVEPRSDVVR